MPCVERDMYPWRAWGQVDEGGDEVFGNFAVCSCERVTGLAPP
jgi:hypothetical protein